MTLCIVEWLNKFRLPTDPSLVTIIITASGILASFLMIIV